MNVKIIKLISGEELIGEFDEKTNTITNPVVMIPVNNKSIGFSPWMPYSEDKIFQLNKEHVMLVCEPSKIITNEYNRAFGSGLVIP